MKGTYITNCGQQGSLFVRTTVIAKELRELQAPEPWQGASEHQKTTYTYQARSRGSTFKYSSAAVVQCCMLNEGPLTASTKGRDLPALAHATFSLLWLGKLFWDDAMLANIADRKLPAPMPLFWKG